MHSVNELDETEHSGIKRAASRRLQDELGIPAGTISPCEFRVVTRILYGAPSDLRWGEHEVDYILFVKKDVNLDINKDEVAEVCYVSLDDFQPFLDQLATRNVQLTPWFHLIVQHRLIDWWKNIDNIQQIAYDPRIQYF